MKKILIIEDDKFLLRVYKTKLDKAGYEVKILEDGVQGLSEAKSMKPDLIITDLVMPNKDGFKVVEELKRDSATKSIPIIALTNLSQEEDKKRLAELGVSTFLVKSDISFKNVLEIISKTI